MPNNPGDTITASLTALAALSVATERVTQIIKQWLTGKPWLKPKGEVPPVLLTHLIAFFSGVFVAILSGQNPIGVSGFQTFKDAGNWQSYFTNGYDWISWLLSGVLISGGSAFWNHALDLIQAAKVQKEQSVNASFPQGATKIAQ